MVTQQATISNGNAVTELLGRVVGLLPGVMLGSRVVRNMLQACVFYRHILSE
jgi:hypothetical protein